MHIPLTFLTRRGEFKTRNGEMTLLNSENKWIPVLLLFIIIIIIILSCPDVISLPYRNRQNSAQDAKLH